MEGISDKIDNMEIKELRKSKVQFCIFYSIIWLAEKITNPLRYKQYGKKKEN